MASHLLRGLVPVLRRAIAALRWGAGVWMALGVVAGGARAAGLPARSPDVLVICSYAPGYAWSDDMLQGVTQPFRARGLTFEPVVQYLDYRRFPQPEREAWILADTLHKIRLIPPRLIITLDDPALDFLLRHRTELGERIPVVFGGVNHYTPGRLGGQRGITGVSEESDFSGTFRLIDALRPAARHVLVIGNRTVSSVEKRRSFAEHAATRAGRYTLEYFENWTNAQLLDRVATLPDDWVGLILDVTQDAAGVNNYNNFEFSRQLAARARVPLFLTARPPGDNNWSVYAWDGVGGGMVAADVHGAKVGELALRVLDGEPVDQVPIVLHSPQRLEVDFRQMARFGLALDRLPPGTTVINRPQTQYRVDRSKLIQAGLLFLVLCAVIVVLSVNILRRQRAERALRQAEEQLRNAQKLEAVGLLAGGVAHDFNNILQVIRGHCEFLAESVQGLPQAREDVSTIRAAAVRASQLTQQLLAFSRKQPLQVGPFAPAELVGEVVRMLRRVLGEHIELRTDLQPGPDPLVADRGQIEQVLVNLCLNARDAMPSGGRIEISLRRADAGEPDEQQVRRAGPHLVLAVADNGEGMSAEVKARLFEPFYTTKALGKGTGLGLAVVYGIVRQHGGTIHVASAPGRGTTFRISLPLGVAERSTATPAPGGISAPRGEGTILLAEDDEAVRRVSVRFLEEAGYRVLTASDGEEALRCIQAHEAELRLVILDVIMPRLNGRQVYEAVRERHPRLRVLFCSGYSAEMLPPEVLPAQGVGLLRKPYTGGELLGRVQQVLRGE